MILPDVNALVYALRQDDPKHEMSRVWLEAIIRGDATFALSKMTLSAVVRIATNTVRVASHFQVQVGIFKQQGYQLI